MVYIVIPVYNRWLYTQACLVSLHNQTYKDYKIVVVDHGSKDDTSLHITRDFPNVIILTGNENMWWAEATNIGVKYALNHKVNYILTLNNDLIVEEDYLLNLVTTSLKHPFSIIGSVSVDICNKDYIAYAGTKWNAWFAKYSTPVSTKVSMSLLRMKYEVIETDLLPGRGTLIPIEVFKLISPYNNKKFPHYMADEDFSLRAKKIGYTLLIDTASVVYSHINATGLESKKNNKIIHFFNIFTSIKSPNKISIRWNWSKNGKIPIFYFALDIGRVFISQLRIFSNR